MKKRIIAVLVLVLCIIMLPAAVSASESSGSDLNGGAVTIIESGSCGAYNNSVYYELDSNGLLRIYGTGKMSNHEAYDGANEVSVTPSPFLGNDKIKEVVVESGVTYVGGNMFKNCKNLEKITLADSVTAVGKGAFVNCVALDNVSFPKSVTEVKNYTFSGCTGLKNITLHSSIKSIGNSSFARCTSLEGITIPSSVKTIGEQAFAKSGLTSITIPGTVTEFGEYIFLDCLSLKTAVLSEGMPRIPLGMFGNCPALESVNIPSTCKSIQEDAFEECASLTSVEIPYGCVSIGYTAFNMCDSLREVTIPSTVTSIGAYAFANSKALETISIPSSVTSLGLGAFQGGEKLREIKFGSVGITNVATLTFADCPNLETVTLPDSVETIDYRAFYNSGIKHFDVPADTTRINSGAFEGCTRLESFSAPADSKYYFTVEGVLYDTLGSSTVTLDGKCGYLHTYPMGKKDKTCTLHENIYRMMNPIKNEYVEELIVGVVSNVGSSDTSKAMAVSGCKNLKKIIFRSPRVTFSSAAFEGLTLTAYHSGWAESKCQNYGGNVTWVNFADNIKIITQPVGDSAASGERVSTKVEAEGEGLTYQWYYKDPDVLSTKKSSVTTPEYSFKMEKAKAGRQVYCVITDANGATKKTDTVNFGMINIIAPPKTVSVKSGDTAAVTISAGGVSLTYQWYVKNPGDAEFTKSSISGATYSCTMSKEISGRKIYCEVTDTYGGKVKSDTVTLAMFGVTKQPESAVAASGKTVSTKVQAEGESLKYQWYVKNPGESRFILSSIKTDTYAYQMTSAKSGRQVYCIITDKYGNTEKTKTAVLSMLEITVQPVNSAAQAGKTVSAKVSAVGDGLSYKWYIRDKGQTAYSLSKIIEPVYSYTMTEAKSGRQAYCIVSDRHGNSIKSDTVTFTMGGGELKITKQPKNAVAAVGKTVSATVEAEGEGLTYQWYIKDSGKSVFSKSSVTKNTYSYQMTAAKSGRQAYCIVSDKYGNSEITDAVTFYEPVSITRQPQDTGARDGELISVRVEASGEGLKYQWYVAMKGSSTFTKSSITGNTYKTEMDSTRDGRKIYCVVTDSFGNTAKTNTVTIRLAEELTITKLPSNASAAEGETVRTSVEAVGEGLTYQWYICDAGKSTFSKSSTTGTTYSYVMTAAKSGRRAYCIVTDKYGNSVKTNTVTFTMK